MASIRLAVTGTTGRLGAAICRLAPLHGWTTIPLDKGTMDLREAGAIERRLKGIDYDVLVNAAAITSLEACEEAPDEASAINAVAPGIMAAITASKGACMIQVSSDYVFDGSRPGLRMESEAARPLSHYGRTKLAGERAVLAASPGFWVARVSWLFGPDKPSFVESIRQRAARGQALGAVADKHSCPSFVDDVVEAFARLLHVTSSAGGIVHVCNSGSATWHDYAREILRASASRHPAWSSRPVAPLKLSEMSAFRAPRPVHTAMSNEKLSRLTGWTPRSWQSALKAYVDLLD